MKPWVPAEVRAALDDALRIFELRSQVRALAGRGSISPALATLGRVSAGIAHELSGPAAYMAENAAALRRELVGVAAYVRRMYESGRTHGCGIGFGESGGNVEDVEVGAGTSGSVTRFHGPAPARRAGGVL